MAFRRLALLSGLGLAAEAVLLRSASSPAVAAGSEGDGEAPAKYAADPAAKVEHLLLDIDESVKKSGSDAEFVYATLYSYDHQLETNLMDEMDKVGKDLAKLKAMQQQDAKQAPPARGPIPRGDSTTGGVSLAQADRKATRVNSGASAEFHRALESVQGLVARVQQSDARRMVLANSTCGSRPCTISANPDEFAFSTTFTEAVLRIDRDFTGKIRESMKHKAELVEVIRNARQAQHKTLSALTDLLRGRYKIEGGSGSSTDPEAAADGDEAFAPLSLLQAGARSHSAQESSVKMSNLQYQIEAALKKKEDTHGILMRIKGMLDKTAPVNADSVHGLLAELGRVLKAVDKEQSRADAAKRRCEAQQGHARLEEQGLRSNMALMDVVHNHTQTAIQAARYNLQQIVAKTKDLQLSTEEFSKIVAKTTATLEDQSQDRKMIMAAVEKAHEIVAHVETSGPAASALLEQMLKELQAQEVGERSYRAAEVAFRGSFLAYARSYLQLLRESRGHYESTLSALELYAEEVESDAVAQADSLSTGEELRKESAALCVQIMRFHGHHRQRRQELSRALRSVLPDVPAVLGEQRAPAVAGQAAP